MNTTAWAISRRRTSIWTRLSDYAELTKPRISLLVLLTVAVAGFVARWGQPDPVTLLHALLGTALIAASASALNQWLEAGSDALMDRTVRRPLPSGRLSRAEVFVFGVLTVITGTGYLTATTSLQTAVLGAATWGLYVAVYTPLKSVTPLNTQVGAVAGAMPVFIGWYAVGGQFDVRVAALFMIVYLWQFPHFMAIAWIYRDQYRCAGSKMVTVVDSSGRRAGVQAVLASLALLPVSFVPAVMSPATSWYVLVAFVLGVGQLVCAARFMISHEEESARRLLLASLVYLPTLLAMLAALPLV